MEIGHNGQATFQIGELAKRTALTVDAIRFYERRKLLPMPSRTAGRFRLYTLNDVERLRFVQRLQRLGFSLEEIKQLMAIRAQTRRTPVQRCGNSCTRNWTVSGLKSENSSNLKLNLEPIWENAIAH